MTPAEAHAAAAAEGLALLRADNSTGFKGVRIVKSVSKPFRGQLKHGGRQRYLGTCATPEPAMCRQRPARTSTPLASFVGSSDAFATERTAP